MNNEGSGNNNTSDWVPTLRLLCVEISFAETVQGRYVGVFYGNPDAFICVSPLLLYQPWIWHSKCLHLPLICRLDVVNHSVPVIRVTFPGFRPSYLIGHDFFEPKNPGVWNKSTPFLPLSNPIIGTQRRSPWLIAHLTPMKKWPRIRLVTWRQRQAVTSMTLRSNARPCEFLRNFQDASWHARSLLPQALCWFADYPSLSHGVLVFTDRQNQHRCSVHRRDGGRSRMFNHYLIFPHLNVFLCSAPPERKSIQHRQLYVLCAIHPSVRNHYLVCTPN